MASVVKKQTKKDVRYFIQLSPGENEVRPKISLGKVSRKQAETAKTNIESLISSKNTGAVMPPAVQDWLNGLSDGLRRRLEVLGIIEPKEKGRSFTVEKWIQRYIDKRPDVKPRTKEKWRDVESKLTTFFKGQFINEVTVQQAKDFRVYLQSVCNLAENTIRRHISIARQFFNSALDAELISKNPFRGQSVSLRANPARFFYITQEMALKVLEACPNAQWRLIFVLGTLGWA